MSAKSPEGAKKPKKLSVGEELFWQHCQCYGLNPVRELQFCLERQFKFDFAFESRKLAVEIDGGNYNGGHSRGKSYEAFCRKINLANKLGWTVYRFTTAMVESGEAIDEIRKALGQ